MRLLITRALEDAQETAALLKKRGHEPILAPTIDIVMNPATLSFADVQAVLATSRIGVQALALSTPHRDIPILAVGEATAEAAVRAGFAIVRAAQGTVEALEQLAARSLSPERGALLHVTGSVVAGDLTGWLTGRGFDVRRAILYEARPCPGLPADARAALGHRTAGGALFFSPRTARLFGDLAGQDKPAFAAMTAFCLSEAVGAAARSVGFSRIVVAKAPTQEALLEAIPLERNGPPP